MQERMSVFISNTIVFENYISVCGCVYMCVCELINIYVFVIPHLNKSVYISSNKILNC